MPCPKANTRLDADNISQHGSRCSNPRCNPVIDTFTCNILSGNYRFKADASNSPRSLFAIDGVVLSSQRQDFSLPCKNNPPDWKVTAFCLVPGSEGEADLTPLQKHVAFFDRNSDGVIYTSETYQGFRAIGCGAALSAASAVFINGFLSPKTNPGESPFPYFPIYVKNIHKGKHGSDSGVYDTEGRFVVCKFEEIFQKHAKTNPEALSSKELKEMLEANGEPNDSKGRFASRAEWQLLYNLGKDKEGFLHKDTIEAVYDGSLFHKLEKEKQSSVKK
ncbi:putative peroxygenase 5 [Curcuma longa]|uniref:putative peroxygenase 5 n=1 Tax=Curcuma longa TaxID=136217 RepID=UPI003D9E8AEC